MKKTIVVLLSSLLFTSCASAPPKYSRADLGSANTREEQIALYDSLKAELAANSKGANAESYRALMSDLGRKLSTEQAQQVRDTVRTAQLSSGLTPLSVLDSAEIDAKPIQNWSQSEYDALLSELRQDRVSTEGALAQEQSMMNRTSMQSDPVGHVLALRNIRDLQGNNSEAEAAYDAAYDETHSRLQVTAEQALQGGDYETAMRNYESLKQIDPNFPGIDQMIANSQSGVESSGFRRLLANGDVEGAYSAFMNLSGRDLSPAQKQEFIGPVRNLAEFFANDAQTKIRAKQYWEAYVTMQREMTIREWTNEPSQISNATIAEFTAAMFDLSAASVALDRFGLEYGYLLLVEEFDPNYSSLESRLRESSEIVYDKAIRRIGAVTINSPDPSKQQIASQIAAGVREYLMENIPEDVKILERDKLDDIRRERVMSDELDARGNRQKDLESTDYLIEGDLLTAQVDEETGSIKDRKRVVTGEAEVSNPAFEAWIKEKGKRKANHPDAPPKTIMQPVEEDIVINIEERRKYGEVGVSYRVIDTTTAEHVHGDSISHSKKVSAQGQEGVQIGTYVQEARMADLPSDMNILNELVDQVVDEMSQDLVAYLANPDGDYFENCKLLNAEDQNVDAAEQCANAAVLRQFKEQDNTDVVIWLKKVTLKSGMRAD